MGDFIELLVGIEEYAIAARFNVQFADDISQSKLLDKLFSELIQDHIIDPTFVMDHPKVTTPLAKTRRDYIGRLNEYRRVLLQHPDTAKHGFQYVDWRFDGEDLIAACRTAFDDDQGGAHNFHDANYLTFHRIADFRRETAEN